MELYGGALIRDKVPNLPNSPGVYRLLDTEHKPLYIGKAKDLKKRVVYYAKDGLTARLRHMVSQVRYLEYTITKTEAEALLLEASLIKTLQPRFNILLRDDKAFPYLRITTDHLVPQISKYRGKLMKGGKFFGPFASVRHLEYTIKEVTKIFKLRSCSDNYFAARKSPCLLYQIRRCSAPCVNKITPAEYQSLVHQALDFLAGRVEDIIQNLTTEMQQLANEFNYEAAAAVRDRIKALSYLGNNNSMIDVNIKDADIIAIAVAQHTYCVQVFIYRGGKFFGNKAYFPKNAEESEITEVLMTFIGQFYQTRQPPAEIILSHSLPNLADLALALKELHLINTKFSVPQRQSSRLILVKNAIDNANAALKEKVEYINKYRSHLQKLQQLFSLPRVPSRVEIYDNSHIMGQYAVGVMVVANEEGFAKDEYRKFNIRNIDINKLGGDDYKMLREVLERRMKYLETEPEGCPDLMIIDGGKAHLAVASEVVTKYSTNIKVVAIAKGPNRNSGGEFLHQKNQLPFTLDNDNPVMQYLQVLRDEAHGFAIRSHRYRRSKSYKGL